jgi:transcription-repair coupling factor (superfamily II helicase)
MHSVRSDHARLLEAAVRATPVLQAAQRLTNGNSPVRVKPLAGAAKALFTAALHANGDRPYVIITADDRGTEDWSHDLRAFLPDVMIGVMRTPPRRSILSSGGVVHHDHVDALSKLHQGGRNIVVLTASVLALPMPPLKGLDEHSIELTTGQTVAYEDLVTRLLSNGYERTEHVGAAGQLSVRGGILDVFPGGWDNPIRIEFWGDTIESIREFEPLSQRSIRERQSAHFLVKVFHDDDPTLTSLVSDHVLANAIVVLDEPEAIKAALHEGDTSLGSLVDRATLQINPLGTQDVHCVCAPQPAFAASIEQALKYAASLHHRGFSISVVADGMANTRRIRELYENMVDVEERDHESLALQHHRAIDAMDWVAHALSAGFVWDDIRMAVITEHQIFGRQRAQPRKRSADGGMSIRELQQLHRGEYVVHEDKGIGQFLGLETIKIGGSNQECVKIGFAGDDVLYVHLNYIHKLSKFAAEEGSLPRLSKLGSAEWERRKSRAKKRIKDIARDLIKLYAKRKMQKGFSYPADTIWQKEFEASFQYEDTVDQARATAEVKGDMEQPTPMDRLICGDVGFGKTEIAVRAAFKAAQAGKQVGVLVPTTILAQQHFITFRDRLQRYPVRIEVLSRFRTKAEQTQILERLKNGEVDIVVGTHRLLSKDVVFKDLGLLIIDEEHRFGVAAKEKLRQLRAAVDTVTLTATPIPRTLNFSLMGARDLSIIETPPRNRLPVNSEILQWDDEVLREALLLEMERGGQTFVVTDRIQGMEKLQMKIKMLLPTLRIAVAHGQMEAEQLENVMEGFLERTYDVLIATKIVESGLDIPNANTIIIENADNFGLAELYQLRGRVGRSNIQAYCYLVIPGVHMLSRTALRRLQALEEFTDLGSGFQLAMRDLEIRGAGNLLGGEQSGFITDMGFEMYQRILEEAVAELRHEEFAELFGDADRKPVFTNEDVAIELDRDALLPSSYVPNDTDRYQAYRQLFAASDPSLLDAIYTDLRDRFGKPPAEVDELFFAVRLRIAAMPIGLIRVNLKQSTLVVEFPSDDNTRFYEVAFKAILPFATAAPNMRFIQNGKRLLLEVLLNRREDAVGFLEDMYAAIEAETTA